MPATLLIHKILDTIINSGQNHAENLYGLQDLLQFSCQISTIYLLSLCNLCVYRLLKVNLVILDEPSIYKSWQSEKPASQFDHLHLIKFLRSIHSIHSSHSTYSTYSTWFNFQEFNLSSNFTNKKTFTQLLIQRIHFFILPSYSFVNKVYR